MTILREFRGTRYTLTELSQASGVAYNTLHSRLFTLGWTVEQAVMTPSPKQHRAGVVFNFVPLEGTGAGSTAQESPKITFPNKALAE